MALIKSNAEIAILRQGGQKLAEVLAEARQFVRPGLKLVDLDAFIYQQIEARGSTPSFLGHEGFPNASCLSLNEQIVHGIPDQRVLKDGDVLGIDVGLWYKKLCVDSAITVIVGAGTPEAEQLLKVTEQALEKGIKAAKPFRRVGSISHAVQEVGQKHGYGIVRTLTGHGVGHHVHEPPEVPNWGEPGDGALLKPGMVLAIEPMFTLGSGEVVTEIDGWGVIAADHTLSAHFEHTIAITGRGVEVLTRI
ncbi:type I methionyl aminopeptidase [Patescibacteria group bacterium]|nr:type I methionyl aminopeptidase [Patescibacteria group bacterium]